MISNLKRMEYELDKCNEPNNHLKHQACVQGRVASVRELGPNFLRASFFSLLYNQPISFTKQYISIRQNTTLTS
jgi:hypothetical protein